MKRWMLMGLVAITVGVTAAGCTKSGGGSGGDGHGAHASAVADPGAADKTEAVWRFTPDKPIAKSGLPSKTNIEVQVNDHTSGKPVEKFAVSHEKLMHLIVVSKDLTTFLHLHPEYVGKGKFQVEMEFPSGGDYKLFADYVPSGGAPVTKSREVKVEGFTSTAVPIVPDASTAKTVDGVEVSLKLDGAKAGEEAMLTFRMVDAGSKQPVKDLQPYLGAVGHVVILDAKAEQYLHVHPMDEKAVGPNAEFMTVFPHGGDYKVWGQFQRNGNTFIVPFVVRVSE
ncbi:hypothetical protein [Paenibacillus koleovorans]|uniref:hypothetical protein n=1 Tax=Paenibacillus koleovorans TaxID=121608 RepID=UPI000FD91277|nr:hypothetical protein [Paenibacillus koleovorans]